VQSPFRGHCWHFERQYLLMFRPRSTVGADTTLCMESRTARAPIIMDQFSKDATASPTTRVLWKLLANGEWVTARA
jgi:hypothetical protein